MNCSAGKKTEREEGSLGVPFEEIVTSAESSPLNSVKVTMMCLCLWCMFDPVTDWPLIGFLGKERALAGI